MRDVSELLKRALQLPPEARAALTGALLESLDGTVDADADSAWAAEIEHRIRALDAGAVQLEPWADARKRISG